MKRNIRKKYGMLAVFICVLMLTACGGKTEGSLNASANVSENTEQNSEMEESSGTEETNEQATTSNTATVSGAQEITGYIETTDENSFVINQIFTEEAEDGGQIAFSDNDNKTLIQVKYTDQTAFVICTTTDGGMTSENEDGTKADLNKGLTVLLNGEWDGNDFNAQKVTIYHFE